MSSIRVLVGTKKGAFILTADGKREQWEVSGPHFAGWEMYHLKDHECLCHACRHMRFPLAVSGELSYDKPDLTP